MLLVVLHLLLCAFFQQWGIYLGPSFGRYIAVAITASSQQELREETTPPGTGTPRVGSKRELLTEHIRSPGPKGIKGGRVAYFSLNAAPLMSLEQT